MKTMRGPGLFLAQFAADQPPFNDWGAITTWASSLGYRGVQVPSNDKRIFDLDLAVSSAAWRDAYLGQARDNGIEVTELACHLQGQLVACHPAYDALFDGFAPAQLHNNPAARTVRIYERSTGELCATTTSDPVTGDYSAKVYEGDVDYDAHFLTAPGELLNDLFFARVRAGEP